MATHTAILERATGGTYYAYPRGQSLADWATYRVELEESASPNEGSYVGTIDDANGYEWVVFSGSSQPSDWSGYVATLDLRDSVSVAAIDTEVAAIKAKTDNLPNDPADASDIAASLSTLASTLATIATYIDTEVAAIKAKTDQLTFTVANQVDANALTGGGGDDDPTLTSMIDGDERTWWFRSHNDLTATNTIRELITSDPEKPVICKMNLEEPLSEGATISTIDRVTISPSGPILGDATLISNKLEVAIPIYSAISGTAQIDPGEYLVVVEVTQTDGQLLARQAVIEFLDSGT